MSAPYSLKREPRQVTDSDRDYLRRFWADPDCFRAGRATVRLGGLSSQRQGRILVCDVQHQCRDVHRNARGPDPASQEFLVLDSLPAHKAKIMRNYVASTNGRLELHFLPGYAPELNPDTQAWDEFGVEALRYTAQHHPVKFVEIAARLSKVVRLEVGSPGEFERPRSRAELLAGVALSRGKKKS
jgi:hypothetical protein